MAKLGFLGLGMMGYPMARNLLRAGHEVALWSNQGEKARKLADAEKDVAAPHRKKWRRMRIAFSSAWATRKWRAPSSSDRMESARAHARHCGRRCQHHQPSESRKIGMVLKKKGIEMLDAPCTGSTPAPRAEI